RGLPLLHGCPPSRGGDGGGGGGAAPAPASRGSHPRAWTGGGAARGWSDAEPRREGARRTARRLPQRRLRHRPGGEGRMRMTVTGVGSLLLAVFLAPIP